MIKIRTLNRNNFCIAKVVGKKLFLQPSVDDTCDLSNPVKSAVDSCHDRKCITHEVAPNEPFFFTLSTYIGQSYIGFSHHIGIYKITEQGVVLESQKQISGAKINPVKNSTILVSPFYPQDFSFLADDHSCVMTSDGLIELAPGTFLGHKDGQIQALTANEVLAQLSTAKDVDSPTYKTVKIAPTRTRPLRPKNGTMIHNQVTGKLEIFLNKVWKTIKLED